MASRTYSENVIVLKKTKLKESDLILTMLAEDGRQIRAVAKGARKPTNSFASRLDVFSHASVLMVTGRNMDIVKEAKLVSSHYDIRMDMTLSALASNVAELLVKTTAVGLDNPRLFPMYDAFLDSLCTPGLEQDSASLLGAACLVKMIAQLGFRPCLDSCVECGTPFEEMLDRSPGMTTPFSYEEGGLVCLDCLEGVNAYPLQPNTINWLNSLLVQRFDDIVKLHVDESTLRELFEFCGNWINTQLGFKQKTLEYFLATCLV